MGCASVLRRCVLTFRVSGGAFRVSLFAVNSTAERAEYLRVKIGKAATLIMLQPSAPAREPIAWIHAPSQPLMRSLLSQFQTPTAPRRVSRFFRVWLLFQVALLEQITQPNSDWQRLFRRSFQPSTSVKEIKDRNGKAGQKTN